MLLHSQMLCRDDMDPRVKRAGEAIERATNTQTQLIDDLLDVSRIIAGRLYLERTAVRLSDPIRAAIDELRPIAEEKRVALAMSLEAAPVVDADVVRIQQIVTNLLTNAIKFTPPGGTVRVQLKSAADSAEIWITDTGIGIDADLLPHIFEPFRQGDAGPRRTHRGLGLGLSIVHHLVKLHGGAIDATSLGPGTGSRFVVRLPLVHAEARSPHRNGPQRDSELAADAVERSARRLDRLRVLVVEDDDDTRRLVAALLEEAGARVDVAATAAEGRNRVERERYSAIISDLAMPQEDGYAFMRALRAAKATIPALALTGLVRREDAAAAYDAGFQAYLTKPIDRDKLIAAVAALTAGGPA
jgi:CheY-like chemotaxis protein/two-component sensor histidine kinase